MIVALHSNIRGLYTPLFIAATKEEAEREVERRGYRRYERGGFEPDFLWCNDDEDWIALRSHVEVL